MNNPLHILQALDRHLTRPAEDMADIRFLLQAGGIGVADLRSAFARARMPDVPEIQDLFRAAQPKVIALAERLQTH